MFGNCLEMVRKNVPLVHNITNYVTVNDVANAILACGGSPIMADDEKEVEEITTICNGLCINIGTLNTRTISSMLLAGRKANVLGKPIILDPVGAGASKMRTETAIWLMQELKPTVIRGNISEMKTLISGCGTTKGVDANVEDRITEENLSTVIQTMKNFSNETGAILAITGAIDLICDAKQCYVIRNGRPEMGKITGTGCQLSGILTAYVSANKLNQLEAAAAAVCMMGVAGEVGWSHMLEHEGNATYRNRIIDAIYHMDAKIFEQGANYEMR